MIKMLIHQKIIALLYTYVSKNRTANYMKQKLIDLKGELDKTTIIIQGFNAPFSTVD